MRVNEADICIGTTAFGTTYSCRVGLAGTRQEGSDAWRCSGALLVLARRPQAQKLAHQIVSRSRGATYTGQLQPVLFPHLSRSDIPAESQFVTPLSQYYCFRQPHPTGSSAFDRDGQGEDEVDADAGGAMPRPGYAGRGWRERPEPARAAPALLVRLLGALHQ